MELILYTLRSLSSVVVQPSLIILLLIMGIGFYLKNKKLTTLQKIIIGEELTSPLELTLSQIVLGVLAGILCSITFTVLGITFTETSGIQLLFLLSIILMFIRPRFVCFSYSGAILGLVSIIVRYICKIYGFKDKILDIDIMCLITFIGIMHIVESLLVMFDGDKGSIPVFTKKEEKIVGGYSLNRYWLMPVCLFLAYTMTGNSDVAADSIATPSWWPLLGSKYLITLLASAFIIAMPFFGVVGYSSVTFTKQKNKKKLSSGLYILLFGFIVTAAAQLCRLGVVAEIIILICTPIGHEIMLRYQQKQEKEGECLFISDNEGICILEVVPYSEIYNYGIRPGDKIIRLNGCEIISEREIYEKAKSTVNNLVLDIRLKNGEEKTIELTEKNKNGIRALLVPKEVDKSQMVSVEEQKFSDVLNSVKDKTE